MSIFIVCATFRHRLCYLPPLTKQSPRENEERCRKEELSGKPRCTRPGRKLLPELPALPVPALSPLPSACRPLNLISSSKWRRTCTVMFLSDKSFAHGPIRSNDFTARQISFSPLARRRKNSHDAASTRPAPTKPKQVTASRFRRLSVCHWFGADGAIGDDIVVRVV